MSLVYYPNPVFKKKAAIVTEFDDTLLNNIAILKNTMSQHRAIGIGANMCGILQRIIIVPAQQEITEGEYVVMINPQITEKSEETQTCIEASVSLRGIEAPVTRAKTITVQYQDSDGQSHVFTATGFLATVIQHEIDYLDGIVYLDHLPKAKAQLLREKMQKYLKKSNRQGTDDHSHHHYHGNTLCTHKH